MAVATDAWSRNKRRLRRNFSESSGVALNGAWARFDLVTSNSRVPAVLVRRSGPSLAISSSDHLLFLPRRVAPKDPTSFKEAASAEPTVANAGPDNVDRCTFSVAFRSTSPAVEVGLWLSSVLLIVLDICTDSPEKQEMLTSVESFFSTTAVNSMRRNTV